MSQINQRLNPRARSVKLTIDAQGQIIIVTPKKLNPQQIEAFVNQHQAWIKKTQQKIISNQPIADDKIRILGKWYFWQTKQTSRLPWGTYLYQQKLLINSPQTLKSQQARRRLEEFIKKTAIAYIRPRAQQLSRRMQVSYQKIIFRQQKTRWGSCSSRGTLSFNWRLGHYAPPIIDYVIIHELAHLTYMNHSPQFWRRVQQFDRRYRQHRRYLKQHGMALG